MGSLHVDLDTLQLGMKEVTDAIGNIHKVETEYKQEGVTCLPSYQALQEQLEMSFILSDSLSNISNCSCNACHPIKHYRNN